MIIVMSNKYQIAKLGKLSGNGQVKGDKSQLMLREHSNNARIMQTILHELHSQRS